jgi:hypothetical protein
MKYLWASSPGLTDFPVPLIPGPVGEAFRLHALNAGRLTSKWFTRG